MTRTEELARRAALLERLRAVPDELATRPQWLLWRFEPHPDPEKTKPLKVPYWANGQKRQGQQGSEQDRNRLVPLKVVLQRLEGSLRWTGAGFAFLPGDGLIGIDIDGAVNPGTGEMSDLCRTVVESCQSYTEFSPSGKGLHVIVAGETTTFKDNGIGLEVFCRSQFFTWTGAALEAYPRCVNPIDPTVLAWLREEVERGKANGAATRGTVEASHTPQPVAPERVPPKAAVAVREGQAGDDFRRANDTALQALHAWVPALFPSAKTYRDGYRITSKSLGRSLEEDLQITPEGVMDFGEERGMSPIDVVMTWGPGTSTPKAALEWLATALGLPLKRRPQKVAPTPTKTNADAPVAGGEGVAAPMDEPAFNGEEPEAASSAEDGAATADIAGGGKGKKRSADFWDRLDFLRANFALIYGTDTVYDGEHSIIMKIANMAHAHGSELVKFWKNSKPCANRSEGGRWTVMPEHVVFDPTEHVDPDTHINLFRGFAMKPEEGDISLFLDLLDHLVSRSGETPEECDEVKDYLLSWFAWPLQNPGSKLRTAVVMHGDEGAGKNFLFDLVVEIYGEYGATVGQDELEDKFNDWRSRKLMVVGDEVSSRAELVHNKNRLKALITSTTVQINPKNLPRREEANHINVGFLSNELQPLALDNSDRRYLVIFTPRAREFEFYAALGAWKAAGGAARLYRYLLDYPCDRFDPYAPAPSTSAKRDLIDLNRKSPERFWLEWSEGLLDLPYRSCSGDQAYRAYLKFAQRTGDRFPVQRVLFTRMVGRMADTAGRPIKEKVMKVDYGAPGAPAVRATRMLLVIPPPDEDQGVWATDCWRQFENELRKYLGRSFGADGDQESAA